MTDDLGPPAPSAADSAPAADPAPSAAAPAPAPTAASDDIVIEVRADLDLPGETARQTKIFAAWVLCLFLALVLSSIAASRVGDSSSLTRTDAELAEKRAARARIGLPVGLLLPALLTWIIHHRHRRSGGHARGIYIDVTAAGELRIWGRGYGSRVSLEGAILEERLVDVYAGRLGAWRQRRLKVRAKGPTRGSTAELELATPAIRADLDLDLRAEGGEGDCVELTREDFFRIRDAVLAWSAPTPS
ncbi:MAG: hypothetical protein R3B70_26290 [Polyangiaceae bacterium]